MDSTTSDATATEASTPSALALEDLESAWSARVLDSLSNKARARYKPGRFIAVEGGTARFALPNSIHRDRCAELVAEVEAALAAVVARTVRLQLEVDTTAVDPGGRGDADGRGAGRASDPSDDDIGDIAELRNADDVASSGVERLTRAFPGSQVITHDD